MSVEKFSVFREILSFNLEQCRYKTISKWNFYTAHLNQFDNFEKDQDCGDLIWAWLFSCAAARIMMPLILLTGFTWPRYKGKSWKAVRALDMSWAASPTAGSRPFTTGSLCSSPVVQMWGEVIILSTAEVAFCQKKWIWWSGKGGRQRSCERTGAVSWWQGLFILAWAKVCFAIHFVGALLTYLQQMVKWPHVWHLLVLIIIFLSWWEHEKMFFISTWCHCFCWNRHLHLTKKCCHATEVLLKAHSQWKPMTPLLFMQRTTKAVAQEIIISGI